jgi:hypothetical protein
MIEKKKLKCKKQNDDLIIFARPPSPPGEGTRVR